MLLLLLIANGRPMLERIINIRNTYAHTVYFLLMSSFARVDIFVSIWLFCCMYAFKVCLLNFFPSSSSFRLFCSALILHPLSSSPPRIPPISPSFTLSLFQIHHCGSLLISFTLHCRCYYSSFGKKYKTAHKVWLRRRRKYVIYINYNKNNIPTCAICYYINVCIPIINYQTGSCLLCWLTYFTFLLALSFILYYSPPLIACHVLCAAVGFCFFLFSFSFHLVSC